MIHEVMIESEELSIHTNVWEALVRVDAALYAAVLRVLHIDPAGLIEASFIIPLVHLEGAVRDSASALQLFTEN